MAVLGNPKNTIAVLQKYNFNFQKKFGQNFLINEAVLEEIIEEAGVTQDDFVLEIGPGIGTMTQYLCEAARQVIAVEIDTNLIPILQDTLSEYNNVEVINEDILKVDINALADKYNSGKPIKVVANLPYYITTPIIMGLFESHVPIDSITIMVQKEVADRMQVGPGTKDYGALSLAVQYYAKPEIIVLEASHHSSFVSNIHATIIIIYCSSYANTCRGLQVNKACGKRCQNSTKKQGCIPLNKECSFLVEFYDIVQPLFVVFYKIFYRIGYLVLMLFCKTIRV